MERRLGKIQARHPQVNDLYDLDLRETAEGVRLFWQIKQDRKNWREAREGAYLLRTNLTADTAEELWSKYMQLTEAEASFRALKSELSVRPLFHQLEPRVKAHILVAFLGYALWVTLKHLLKRRPPIVPAPSASGVDNAQPMTPMRAIALLSTLQSANIVLPTTDGREIRLTRMCATCRWIKECHPLRPPTLQSPRPGTSKIRGRFSVDEDYAIGILFEYANGGRDSDLPESRRSLLQRS
jgi:hypothetical protein